MQLKNNFRPLERPITMQHLNRSIRLWGLFSAATIIGADAASAQQGNPSTWRYGPYDKNIQRKLTQDTASVTGATVMEVGIYTARVIKIRRSRRCWWHKSGVVRLEQSRVMIHVANNQTIKL